MTTFFRRPNYYTCSNWLIPLLGLGLFWLMIDEVRSQVWVFRGTETSDGQVKEIQWTFSRDGKYRCDEVPSSEICDGFDGTTSWRFGDCLFPHTVSPSEADYGRLLMGLVTANYSKPNSSLTIRSDGEDRFVKCHKGMVELKVQWNEESKRIDQATCWQADGDQTWSFADWKHESGLDYASSIRIVSNAQSSDPKVDTIAIREVSFDATAQADFSMPPDRAKNFTFDNGANSVVPMRFVHRKLYVLPKINGIEEGWFIFDTGTNALAIDRSISEKHGSKSIGETVAGGGSGTYSVAVCRGPDLQLGPLTLKSPVYITSKYDNWAEIDGKPVIGILGYPYLCRASFAIDFRSQEIKVVPSGSLQLPTGTKWIATTGEVPCIEARFEGDRVGRFHLDTGSPAFVDFTSPTVRKHNLLDRPDLRDVITESGGQAPSKLGTVEWFEVGGRRFPSPRAGFQLTDRGVFSSPHIDGNLGVRMMEQSIVLLDSQNNRIAFAPHVMSAWYATLRASRGLQTLTLMIFMTSAIAIGLVVRKRKRIV
jgi:hypothetical protein